MLAPGWQTITEKGVVRLRKPFKFEWAPTVILERLKLKWSNFVHRYAISSTSTWRTNHP